MMMGPSKKKDVAAIIIAGLGKHPEDQHDEMNEPGQSDEEKQIKEMAKEAATELLQAIEHKDEEGLCEAFFQLHELSHQLMDHEQNEPKEEAAAEGDME